MKPVNAILPRHIRQKLSTKPDDGVKGQKQCGDGAKNHRCPTNERDFPVPSKRRRSRTASKCQDEIVEVHLKLSEGEVDEDYHAGN